MPSSSQDKHFAETMRDSVDEVKMSNQALDTAIDWISTNLKPDDVFSVGDLEEWAETNGYIKE